MAPRPSLANAADGYQLWSERYDREMVDVFAVQDEIAGAVAERDPLVLWSRRLPFWDYHRAHPRFNEVLRKVWE